MYVYLFPLKKTFELWNTEVQRSMHLQFWQILAVGLHKGDATHTSPMISIQKYSPLTSVNAGHHQSLEIKRDISLF